MGRASVGGIFADVLHSGWIANLRARLARACVRFGLPDLDALLVLRASAPRATRGFVISPSSVTTWKIG